MSRSESAHTTKGSSTREKIIHAARQKLIANGFDAFVMRELADEVGIKLGNLQYYFKTKELLVLEVLTLEAAKDVDFMTEGAKNLSAKEHFAAIVEELVSRWRGDSGVLFSMLSALALHNKTFRQLYRSIYTRFYKALEGPLTEINPNLSEQEVALKVRLVTALVDGSPMQVQVGKMEEYLKAVKAEAERIAIS